MYGYVFISKNNKTGKQYIGICRSVKFIRNYFGDLPEIQKDVANYGPSEFSVQMLMPYETEAGLLAGEQKYLADYKALTDSNFYNAPVKKPVAKKKATESEK